LLYQNIERFPRFAGYLKLPFSRSNFGQKSRVILLCTGSKAMSLRLPNNGDMPEKVVRLMGLYSQRMTRQLSVAHAPRLYRSKQDASLEL
jgi:Serine dehydrogenase proteinase